ncbi:50S ribosomal protein L4 [candidate division WWE3 bacterium]|uniref:Large ribosomal subunit protein uL4 n=1 Tax=candidate division WWE3 bacterium TaxID=2053526 RepID=A0A7X9DKN9_UNCKA|nr:50S ribosomal protein L4 [candidate division WWE3 bacterium]
MKVNLFDTKGNIAGELTLNDAIFGVDPNFETIKQYIYVYLTNQRQGTSSTKTRGEVQGSAAKPWAQKGTGRARAGEKRNPIWRHGGIAHGPKPKDWRIKVSRSVRDSAFISALSLLAQKSALSAVEKLNFEKPETKVANVFVKNTGLKGKTLLVLGSHDKNIVKSFSNIKDVETTLANNLNVYDLMNTKNVIFEKSALESFEKKFLGGEL